ncbi:MAG TPA: hypothetical protein VES42_03285 [Pilimelia sp.]|nr:hypothetical protein [Pilimelia sp.]
MLRTRIVLAAAVACIVLGGVLIVPAAFAKLRGTTGGAPGSAPSPTASPTPPPPPPPPPKTLAAQPVSVTVPGFFSWALLDRRTGRIGGSRNIAATNSTESMIKIFLVSDYLRRQGTKEVRSARLKQGSAAIRDSNDNAAQALYNAGGRDAVVRRMISICKLTDTKPFRGWWSRTQMSARDAVRLGQCVADGRAAGSRWTSWVITEMRKVRGTTAKKDQALKWGGGRWGIIDGLPPEMVSRGVGIKNGWTAIWADGQWHINCLGIANDWVLAVLMRFPVRLGLDYGAGVCKRVTQQLVHQPPAPAQ